MTTGRRSTPKQVLLWFSVILIIVGVLLSLLGYGLFKNAPTGLIGVIAGAIGLFLLLITQFIKNK